MSWITAVLFGAQAIVVLEWIMGTWPIDTWPLSKAPFGLSKSARNKLTRISKRKPSLGPLWSQIEANDVIRMAMS